MSREKMKTNHYVKISFNTRSTRAEANKVITRLTDILKRFNIAEVTIDHNEEIEFGEDKHSLGDID